MSKVLVVDDDRTILHMVRQALEQEEIEVLTAGTSDEGLAAVKSDHPDVVLLDIMLPDTSGLEIFREIQAIDKRLPIIFITAGNSSSTAIDAMQLGAFDYVLKPLDLPSLKELVAKAIETRLLMRVPVAVPTGDANDDSGERFVGRSSEMLDVFKAIGRVASQNVTVLIRGESGTGKELVARAIYQHSPRSEECFMAVNCAAIPDTLLESELFGHEKGSFTGAEQRRIGKFEQCNGGTIFLDEIGDMSPLVQGKVLRLLQEQKFERVGGNETVETDVRIIAATNRNLEKMVDKGEFRSDLFYRLNGVTIALPPLCDRQEDISALLEHFLTQFSREMGKGDVEGISPEALALLKQYAWPGNVRELQSVVKQALLNATGPVIVPAFLPEEVRGPKPKSAERTVRDSHSTNGDDELLPDSDLSNLVEQRLNAGSTDLYAEALELMERYLVTRVLQSTGGNQTKASKILGITRGKIRDRIAAFGISLGKTVALTEDESDD